MSEVTVTLNDVESKDVKVKGDPATVYEFRCSDGNKYTTFKRDIAVPGSQLRGRLVTIDYTEKQKGDYTNYYLNSIKLADTGDAGLEVNLRGTDGFGSTPIAQGITTQEDKNVSIARAVALKAAVETAVGLQLADADSDAILGIANVYAGWLLTGSVNEPVAAGDFPF